MKRRGVQGALAVVTSLEVHAIFARLLDDDSRLAVLQLVEAWVHLDLFDVKDEHADVGAASTRR